MKNPLFELKSFVTMEIAEIESKNIPITISERTKQEMWESGYLTAMKSFARKLGEYNSRLKENGE